METINENTYNCPIIEAMKAADAQHKETELTAESIRELYRKSGRIK